MRLEDQFAAEDVDLRRYEYDDAVVLAADFGPTESSSVEIVGDTVIVIADDEQFDIELTEDAQAFMENGVLTIEVSP